MKKVSIASTALHDMRDLVLENPNIEVGGVMIGAIDADYQTDILFVSPPGQNAHSGELTFQADASFINGVVYMANLMTNGKMGYLGLWHSHPTGNPHPSPADEVALLEMHNYAIEVGGTPPMMLIAAVKNQEFICRMFGVNAGQIQEFEIEELSEFEITINHSVHERQKVEA